MKYASISFLLAALILAGCGGGGGGGTTTGGGTPLNPVPFVGTYTGQWNNTTFGSSGASTMVIGADTGASTLTMSLDLDGNVFGGANPPADNLTGTYTTTQAVINGVSPVFGNLSFTIDAAGNFNGGSNDVPGTSVQSITYTGTITSTAVNLNYVITFEAGAGGGTAVGTLQMTKP